MATLGIPIPIQSDSGFISNTGNIVTSNGYFIGNGSQLTGIATSYGNSNVATFLASYGSNTISTTGNITSGNLTTIGNVLASNFVGTGTGTPTITSITNLDLIASGGNINVTGNILPSANIRYDLGSPTQKWKTAYFAATTIYLGETALSTTNIGGLVISNSTANFNVVTADSSGQSNTIGNMNIIGSITSNTLTTGTVITGNIIPSTDNTYFLGNSTNRWANIWVGPGTIYITDSNVASNNTAELTVLNGVLQINGADQLQVGQLKFVNNTIESTTGNIDIQIGLANSTANLSLLRNTVVSNNKTLTVTGNTTVGNLTINGNIFYNPKFGSFYSNANQTATLNTPTQVLLNNVSDNNGVTYNSDGNMTIVHPGIYSITTVLHLVHPAGGGGLANVVVWLRKNGVDIPNSSSTLTIDKGTNSTITLPYLANVTTGSNLSVVWAQNQDVSLIPVAANSYGCTHPAVPSAIISIQPVGA